MYIQFLLLQSSTLFIIVNTVHCSQYRKIIIPNESVAIAIIIQRKLHSLPFWVSKTQNQTNILLTQIKQKRQQQNYKQRKLRNSLPAWDICTHLTVNKIHKWRKKSRNNKKIMKKRNTNELKQTIQRINVNHEHNTVQSYSDWSNYYTK